jgi:molybdopterin synthase sulfur carrier subunit
MAEVLEDTMQIQVRLSGTLVQQVGRAHLSVTVADDATVETLKATLEQTYPQLQPGLQAAVPIISGRHVGLSHALKQGEQVAFLMPIAGG